MRHDHAALHGGRRGPCNKQGLMSYGRRPEAWSRCSNADFESWYRRRGRVCLLTHDATPAQASPACLTTMATDHPARGQPCHFPFTSEGEDHQGCLVGEDGRAWCATAPAPGPDNPATAATTATTAAT